MSIFDVIAENKIQAAIQKGQLDQPALFGQPIHVDDDFSISAESRFLIRRMQAITGASLEPSPLVARWRAMQYQKCHAAQLKQVARNLAINETKF